MGVFCSVSITLRKTTFNPSGWAVCRCVLRSWRKRATSGILCFSLSEEQTPRGASKQTSTAVKMDIRETRVTMTGILAHSRHTRSKKVFTGLYPSPLSRNIQSGQNKSTKHWTWRCGVHPVHHPLQVSDGQLDQTRGLVQQMVISRTYFTTMTSND